MATVGVKGLTIEYDAVRYYYCSTASVQCIVCDCAGEASGVWRATMDQNQSSAGTDRRRSTSRRSDRLCLASSQPQRRNDHAHLVSRRRADEDAEDDHPAAYHIKPHLRYGS